MWPFCQLLAAERKSLLELLVHSLRLLNLFAACRTNPGHLEAVAALVGVNAFQLDASGKRQEADATIIKVPTNNSNKLYSTFLLLNCVRTRR